MQSSPSAAPSLEDFEQVKVVGKGSYGKVFLVKHKSDPTQVYAMKTLQKDDIVKRNQTEHTKTERKVLQSTKHPFIVDLYYAFQTPKKLCFVLEFCPGGELFTYLAGDGRFPEHRTQFYSAEVVLAIGYLHSLDIIFRDLKPENILMDAEGHVKLTDFGLSKEGITDNYGAKSMCGTPEYLAPEILDKKGHGKAVDWYSVGALVFEMFTGAPPFYTKDRQKLFDNIKRGNLHYPNIISDVGKDFIQKLMVRDPAKRMGAEKDVKAHRFFSEARKGIPKAVDWQALYKKQVTPPFKPKIDPKNLAALFDKEFTRMPVANSEHPGMKEKHRFEGFTYEAPSVKGTSEQAAGMRSNYSVGSVRKEEGCLSGCTSGCSVM